MSPIEIPGEVLKFLAGTSTTDAPLTKLIRKEKSEVRLLLEELRKNEMLCRVFINESISPASIIPSFSTEVYVTLLEKGFEFNELSQGKDIRVSKINKSNLSSFNGKDMDTLIGEIYDKINELQIVFSVDPNNPFIDWNRRIVNLRKRILFIFNKLIDNLPTAVPPPASDVKKKRKGE